MTACPIRYQRQVPDRKGKIFYTSITSLSHISKYGRIIFNAELYSIICYIITIAIFLSYEIKRKKSPFRRTGIST
jgi:hypothetical protein